MRAAWSICGVMLALAPASGQAQEEPGLVLMVPEEVRAEWTAALQVELASRGATVEPADPPTGATVLLRDAHAQQAARERGAAAAAWVEETERGWNLRLIGVDATEVRVTPVSSRADARTFALILASLLDEPLPPGAEEPVAEPTPSPDPTLDTTLDTRAVAGAEELASASTLLADPGEPARVARSGDVPEPSDTPSVEPGDPGALRWSGIVGTAGFAIANDSHFEGGALVRGGVGLRLDGFEAALHVDLGAFLERVPFRGDEVQALFRTCLEAGGVVALDVGLHLGGRSCVGLAEMRTLERFDPIRPPMHVDRFGGLWSFGGYAAVSFDLARWVRFFIRAELEAAILEAANHPIELIPVLSTSLSFS
ncbi:MAG: hypothetical protein SangKO_088900 [Sandaracinaceae bacterium]